MDTALADELIERARRDAETRARLAETGELFDGYHDAMRAVHEANADWLLAIVQQVGWPVADAVGDAAAEAAWLIAQHAISRPHAMRRFAALREEAVARGAASGWRLAMLTDRIRTFEGRPQLYGTQFDWDESGELSPLPIEDAANVDERRAALGLSTLAERIAEMRARAEAEGETPPVDLAARKAEADRWASAVGWRSLIETPVSGRSPSPSASSTRSGADE